MPEKPSIEGVEVAMFYLASLVAELEIAKQKEQILADNGRISAEDLISFANRKEEIYGNIRKMLYAN